MLRLVSAVGEAEVRLDIRTHHVWSRHAQISFDPEDILWERAMQEGSERLERVINVRDIDPRHRHAILSQLFDHLDPESSLQLVVDHDPRPLRYQLEARHGSRCNWCYLEQGPEVWRVRLRHLRD